MDSFPRLSAAGASLLDRRGFLGHAATAAGGMALLDLLAGDGLAGDGRVAESGPITPVIDPSDPYAPRSPHFPARAKRLIVIFCAGAVSQLETWDWKPELVKYDDKPLPGGPAVTWRWTATTAPPRRLRASIQPGSYGTWRSGGSLLAGMHSSRRPLHHNSTASPLW